MAADVDLGPEHFEAFFRAVHAPTDRPPADGPTPFPWQQRLAERIIATGNWPTLLDLPTGSGKTAALDVAVFVQAVRSDAPRRTVFVVDRRVIVQQAAERARRLATRLAHPGDDAVLVAVARRLLELAAPCGRGDEPLRWAELRGGIVRDESWAMRPDVPAIIVSTVDQVGSRLLFRGYGVSPSMRPVHAGLLGNDVLFLLDEVHLSQPFTDTLGTLTKRYRPPTSASLPERWRVVQLSATPGQRANEDRFHLDAADMDRDRSEVLSRRLASSKPVRTELIKVGTRDTARSSTGLVSAVARHVKELFDRPYVRSVLVVVNRVATAVAVARAVAEAGIEAPLLTGRMRPFDREDALKGIVDRLSIGRQRGGEEPRMVLVSTQAVEAGADFDLDGIVTECASLDALRQRFGRVDRDGVLSAAGTPAPGVILATSDQVGADAVDAVYGAAVRATWKWLQGADRDFGYGRMTLPAPEELATLLAPKPDAPVVLPAYLDAWVQTSPAPSTDPDVGLWLHGVGVDQQPDVNVVWRADLSEELLDPKGGEDAEAIALTAACPPCSGEAMAVPMRAVRAWLRGRHGAPADVPDVADVEGGAGGGDDEPPVDSRLKPRPCLVWAGRESRVVSNPADLRAGNTVVVPATYGGVSNRNWDPTAADPVTDLGLRAQAVQRRRAVLRLHPELMKGLPEVPDPCQIDEDDGDDRAAVAEWLNAAAAVPSHEVDSDLRRVIKLLRGVGDPGRRVERVPASGGLRLVVTSARLLRAAAADSSGSDPETVDSEPDDSSLLGVPVPLDQHLSHVEGWARATASACGLPPAVVNDVVLAGRLHDLGKCDVRFQRYLRGGDVLDATAQPLAKSGMLPLDRQARHRARRAAGYPQGEQHELLSVALAAAGNAPLRSCANDWDLVLHLIASHHGSARPFVPVAHDRSPVLASHSIDGHHLEHSSDHRLARLDSGVPDRFWRLVRRYGWFGLAWLEATLRLADHRASAEEQAHGVDANFPVTENEEEAS